MGSISKLNAKGMSDPTRLGSQLIKSLGPHNGEACVDEILAVDIDGRQGVLRRRVTVHRESDYQEAQKHLESSDFWQSHCEFWHKHHDTLQARYRELRSRTINFYVMGCVTGLLLPSIYRVLRWLFG
jgi:hypothetical protein